MTVAQRGPWNRGLAGYANRRLTPELREEVVRLARRGVSDQEIRRILGLCQSTVENARRNAGIMRRPPLTGRERTEVLSLYLAGLPVVEIARRYAMTPQGVYALRIRTGVPKRTRSP